VLATPISLSVSDELIRLLEQYNLTMGGTALADFIAFASSEKCTSLALKMQLLAKPHLLSKKQVKTLAKALGHLSFRENEDDHNMNFGDDRGRLEPLPETLSGSRHTFSSYIWVNICLGVLCALTKCPVNEQFILFISSSLQTFMFSIAVITSKH
jgi:hypothetical protein